MLNKDCREMLKCLSDEGVKYLVVGAYALAVHGFPRATKSRIQEISSSPYRTTKHVVYGGARQPVSVGRRGGWLRGGWLDWFMLILIPHQSRLST